MDSITGKLKYIVYTSPDGSFSVADFKTPEGRKKIVGNIPMELNKTFKLNGEYTIHKKYGKAFKVESYELCAAGNDKNSVVEFLTSGCFKGIGAKTAERIYSVLGEDTLDKIKADPDCLLQVKGISETKRNAIVESLKDNNYLTTLIEKLDTYGFSAAECMKLYKKHGKKTLRKLEDDVYTVMDDLRMSFYDADAIAMKMGFGIKCRQRIEAALKTAMYAAHKEGNTGIEAQRLGRDAKTLLGRNVTIKDIEPYVLENIKSGFYKVVRLSVDKEEHQYIFPCYMFAMEESIAGKLAKINEVTLPALDDVCLVITQWEEKNNITLDMVQRKAVETALTKPLVVITGGPGTGKTTIMDAVASINKQQKRQTVLLAPTGRAARKLAESTGHETFTIHSYLGVYDVEDGCEDKEIIPEDNTTFIVDEFSMADTSISELLFRKIGECSNLILVGDTDQLPSVGAGAVLRDIISSGIARVIRLSRIFRTATDNNIYENTERVNKGVTQLMNGKGFNAHLVREQDPLGGCDMEKCKELLTDMYMSRIIEYGIDNVMLLLPYKKNTAGVEDMNSHLQALVNPPSPNKEEIVIGKTVLREGDQVMHVHTNKEDVSNGDIGYIFEIEKDKVIVSINDKLIPYDREDLQDLTHAYAMTVHKSQGSEAKAVVVCITSAYPAMLYRNIPYVAFSRAKEVLDVVYDEGLKRAIETQRTNKRITLLEYFIKRAMGEWIKVG